ncbi:hypothetical protein MWU75_13035 [Ornithinimicrobium sp. F0845]|uniref:phage tail protein n=1 Tax=Ornithinimicrobium sp. F0845 TaxID=2926412 RepID=UPI001FF688B0|nr:hypothetical protein [Ornithinimicrobium sp. F0845]MCK0113068.1 hypothetical protein [Ornithinimicrobium sp. F0845]
MGAARQMTDPARRQAARALEGARRRTDGPTHGASGGTHSGGAALLALQRRAGNAAVSALLTGKGRAEGAPAERMEEALGQLRREDPAIDVVETGLKEAKAAGVPVDLEGTPPPAAALAVTLTGFGPGSVAPKKAPLPPKSVPKVPALGKAAKGAGAAAKGKGGAAAAKGKGGAEAKGKVSGGGPGPVPKGGAGAPAGPTASPAAGLAPDQVTQPPVPPPGILPGQDPAFTAVTGGLSGAAATARAHGPAAAKAKEAQAAAMPPAGGLAAQAEAAKVDEMDAQQPGAFDKKAFITAVKAAIEAKSPKTLEEADEYRESGKAGDVKGDVAGLVTQGKGEQTKDIATATEAPPDQSRAVAKEVVPMGGEPVGQVPSVPAGGAVPKPAPPEQTNLQAGKHQAEAELAGADVTEEQLERSNEPDFQQAVADKREAAEHADTAPGEFRQQEQQVIEQDRAGATAGVTEAVAGMQGTRAGAIAGLVADKAATKEEDEGKRGEVAGKIDAIYVAAEQDVKAILDGIDPKVEKAFGDGEAAARAAFESYVDAKMSAYKRDRYGGWLGGLKWAKDKLLGMPSKVNEFYEAGRELYLKKMDGVISRVADIVGGDLTRAKKRIAAGRAEITAYVKNLPADLRKTGAKAAQEIGDRFASLEGEVTAKQEAAVDMLASKYVESRKALDSRIEELQAANKGLVDKAIGAIKGVINTIRELAAMLENVLSRVAGVVGKIIKDPIGFLGNLIAGVKGGILKFRDNILEHLRKGLMGWLFGALAEGGVELPESFDLKGIVKLLASLFGLTWRTIRDRILKRVGARAMGAIERGVEIFQVLASQGLGGLWEMLLEKLGNIKDMILEQVQEFVVVKIIKAGITWLIGLLNPAAAFIKACKMIYDIVMFFVANAARIGRFVNTVIDSVADIVRGNVSGVVDKINNVLGQMLPLIIGFLASAIGLGGIGKKIREIVNSLQKPFLKAVDFVIDKGLKLAGPLIRGLKALGGRAKAGAKRAFGRAKSAFGFREKTPEEVAKDKRERLDKGMAAGVAAVNRFARKPVGKSLLAPLLSAIRIRYRMKSLEPVLTGRTWSVAGTVNPSETRGTKAIGEDSIAEAKKHLGERYLVKATNRVGQVTSVLEDHGFVVLTYDRQRTIGGTSQTMEGRPSFPVGTFLENVKNNGPALVKAEGGAGQTAYTLDGRTLREQYHRVRAMFYKGDYQKHLEGKLSAVTSMSPPGMFLCPGYGREPHLAPIASASLDHRDSVALHWNTTGRSSNQAERSRFWTDETNLQVLCGGCNSRKGSRGPDGKKANYMKEVEIPGFSGPDGKE